MWNCMCIRWLINWSDKHVSALSHALRRKRSPLNVTFTIPNCLKYINKGKDHNSKKQQYSINFLKYRLIQKIGLSWSVNGASTHARLLVAVFQVLYSLYGLTCMGYAQNSLAFVSRSPLIHVVDRNVCLYAYNPFAQIGDSNDKCSSSLEVECWNEDETHAAQQSPTQF